MLFVNQQKEVHWEYNESVDVKDNVYETAFQLIIDHLNTIDHR